MLHHWHNLFISTHRHHRRIKRRLTLLLSLLLYLINIRQPLLKQNLIKLQLQSLLVGGIGVSQIFLVERLVVICSWFEVELVWAHHGQRWTQLLCCADTWESFDWCVQWVFFPELVVDVLDCLVYVESLEFNGSGGWIAVWWKTNDHGFKALPTSVEPVLR